MTINSEQNIWLVLSNITYLIPAVYLFMTHLFVESFTYFNITFWSSIYHLCFDMQQCIVKNRAALQFMDFFSAYLCIGIIVVYFIDIKPRKYKLILQCLIAIILLFITCLDYFDSTIYIVVLVIFIPAGILYFTIYFFRWLKLKGCFKNSWICNNKLINFIYNNRTSPFNPWDIFLGLFGIILFVISYTIQIFVTDKDKYWITHSIWHALSGISALFIYTVYNKRNILITLVKTCITKCKKQNIDNEIVIE